MTLLLHSVDPTYRPVDRVHEPAAELLSAASYHAQDVAHLLSRTELSQRSWVRVAESDSYEAWAIGWPPGGFIDLHDHGDSAGAIFVVSGQLLETRIVESGDKHGLVTTRTTLGTGDSASFRSGCVHDVVNMGPAQALSVHVYAPRLKQMTYYELAEGCLRTLKTVKYELA